MSAAYLINMAEDSNETRNDRSIDRLFIHQSVLAFRPYQETIVARKIVLSLTHSLPNRERVGPSPLWGSSRTCTRLIRFITISTRSFACLSICGWNTYRTTFPSRWSSNTNTNTNTNTNRVKSCLRRMWNQTKRKLGRAVSCRVVSCYSGRPARRSDRACRTVPFIVTVRSYTDCWRNRIEESINQSSTINHVSSRLFLSTKTVARHLTASSRCLMSTIHRPKEYHFAMQ